MTIEQVNQYLDENLDTESESIPDSPRIHWKTAIRLRNEAEAAAPRIKNMPNSNPPKSTKPRYILLVDWNRKYDWPTQGGLRHLMQYRKTNGFADAFVKVGNRVLIDETKFFDCVARRNTLEALKADSAQPPAQ